MGGVPVPLAARCTDDETLDAGNPVIARRTGPVQNQISSRIGV
jgi:hypothetical protein